ncbi:MAG: hypothetical protein OEV28_10145 [Nitrospirota bacterium]|nr:hypothetical protein [Nitrospirota bacterium]
MTGKERSRTAICSVTVLMFAVFVFILQIKIDSMTDRHLAERKVFYVPSGEYLKHILLGYDLAVADIYWIKTIQYVGEKTKASRTYKWLYPMVDLVTTLDPRHTMAYHGAGVVLAVYAEPRRLEESNAILKKGIKNDPDAWQHPFYLSFNYFHYMNDYETAAKYMAMAAAKPKHPHYVEKLAARLYAEARDPESGILFLASVIESTGDEKVRKELEERFLQLVAERDMNTLDEAIRWHEKKTGKKPAMLLELLVSGALPELPEEPRGGNYYIDKDGNAKSSMMAERLKVYH